MSQPNNDYLLDIILDSHINASKVNYQAYDNLFSANHRNAMIDRYGETMASAITIEDLI
jgi:hypothetical protein